MDPSGKKLTGTEIWLTLVPNTTANSTSANTTESMETELEVGHVTDDSGSFSFQVSLNGRYQLRLKREGWQEEIQEVEIGNCSSKSIEVTMRKKIECEVDLNIHVIDEDDMAVNGAHLFFTVDPSTNNFNLTTPASGIVSTRLPPGPLQVQVLVIGRWSMLFLNAIPSRQIPPKQCWSQ